MSLYRWNDNTLEIHTKERRCRVYFPESPCFGLVQNYNGRFIAIATEKNLYIHDFLERRFFCRSKCSTHSFRFDKNNRLYFIDKKDLRVLDIQNMEDTLLYHVGRKQHNPQNLGVSPNGRFVSFCRYVSDDMRLFVFDTQTNELKDYKLSVCHYAWLDDDRIVYTKSGGLKTIDVQTGKNHLLIRSYKTLAKKGFAQVFEPFADQTVLSNLEFLRIRNGRIYFTLFVFSHAIQQTHKGLWSIGIEDPTPEFHYEIPDGFFKTPDHYLAENEKTVWTDGVWHAFDGHEEETFSNEWKWAIRFEERNA